MEGFVQRNGYLIVEPWPGISGDGQVLEGSKAMRLALRWLLSLSMYKAGSAFQLWLLSSPLLLFSRAVGENIWKGFPGTGGNFQANETLSAQPGTPTPAICSRRHYRVCERNPAVSSSSEIYRCPALGTAGDGTVTAKDLLGALDSGCTSKSFPFSLSPQGGRAPCNSTSALHKFPRTVMKGEAALAVRSSSVSPELSHPH